MGYFLIQDNMVEILVSKLDKKIVSVDNNIIVKHLYILYTLPKHDKKTSSIA